MLKGAVHCPGRDYVQRLCYVIKGVSFLKISDQQINDGAVALNPQLLSVAF
jgi:hypothetical protein